MQRSSNLREQDKTDISGRMILTVSELKVNQVEDTENHQFMLVDFTGENRSTSKFKFLDHAQASMFVFEDRVVKENDGGLQRGYLQLSLKKDMVFIKFDGEVKFSLSDSADLVASVCGQFSFIKGTGQYEQIRGHGTYKGSFISEGTVSIEWSGEFYIEH
jgi:hypothetical protein